MPILKNRRPLSVAFPALKPLIITTRKTLKRLEYKQSKYRLEYNQTDSLAKFRVYKHKSLLRRKLGDANADLQEKKIVNLQLASKAFNH